MPVDPKQKIERTLRNFALMIGVFVSLAMPLGYFAIAFHDFQAHEDHTARFSARQIGLELKESGFAWEGRQQTIAEVLQFHMSDGEPHQFRVFDEANRVALLMGTEQPWPSLVTAAPIIVNSRIIGTVEVKSSFQGPMLMALALAAVGLLFGISAYGCVNLSTAALRRAAQQLAAEHQKSQLALEKAEAANRSKTEFLANMSHELRTPLNAIIGFSDMMRQEMIGSLSDRYKAYAEDIHGSGTHLLEIISDILHLAKIEAGQEALDIELCNVHELIEGCMRIVAGRAEKSGVDLYTSYDMPLGGLGMLDTTKVRQILLNLLSNAVKFTPRGGAVRLAATHAVAGQIVFRVEDTGIGMTEAEIDLAFQPFRQLTNPLSKRFEGTGLGLPLSRRFAELHGGRLLISSAKNRGTIVSVTLPLGEAQVSQAAA